MCCCNICEESFLGPSVSEAFSLDVMWVVPWPFAPYMEIQFLIPNIEVWQSLMSAWNSMKKYPPFWDQWLLKLNMKSSSVQLAFFQEKWGHQPLATLQLLGWNLIRTYFVSEFSWSHDLSLQYIRAPLRLRFSLESTTKLSCLGSSGWLKERYCKLIVFLNMTHANGNWAFLGAKIRNSFLRRTDT